MRALYGDGSLWYVIAEANALNVGPTDRFTPADAGRNLRIPNTNHSLQNTSTNFKPYNPGEIIGDLTPSPEILPPPSAGGGCNVIATIIVVIIVVIVTIYTAGAALGGAGAGAGGAGAGAGAGAAGTGAAATGGYASTWAAGMAAVSGQAGWAGVAAAAAAAAAAAGGFAGSVAGQAAGMALGVQDSFSLRSAFAGALTTAFTAGIGAAAGQGSSVAGFLNEAQTTSLWPVGLPPTSQAKPLTVWSAWKPTSAGRPWPPQLRATRAAVSLPIV